MKIRKQLISFVINLMILVLKKNVTSLKKVNYSLLIRVLVVVAADFSMT